ncbi:type I polyketide synthase [Streptomyces pactum]|uniref:Type I polyketide synthase n=1 Tax=Streptomyces pactum TaxID=68249 RepID=A0A1S6JL02_9ACTN|nr:type I polyketide synthase [Streptomyces pactum]
MDHDGQAVAIVGVSCRLPGDITGLDRLWETLGEGRDEVSSVPADRFDVSRFVDSRRRRGDRSYTSCGGFLGDIAGFDTGYFSNISPREAGRMDPQHRLLLEMAVEALDDAGIDQHVVAGSDTAVFVGISSRDYGDLQMVGGSSSTAYTMAGVASTNAANRISYLFDWNGPSMAVDTACSSSLTALHQACEALRAGRSSMALVGGVNVLLNPMGFVGFSAASMLSPTGRCRPFSAEADGYVRAEGGGVTVLKRLADALADGDRIHGIIRASGANSDGRTAGLAMPSATAQSNLLEQVYASAGMHAGELNYLEAHGTGTPAGDPVECQAIGRALGRHRTNGALPIGSVKSNLGHLEAASGMAGLLKALLILQRRHVPATLHSDTLNPDIDFAGLGIQPCTAPLPLPAEGPLAVGVNSFGFGGSNAHVILGSAPAPAPAPRPTSWDGRATFPVVISARSEEALDATAAAMAERLRQESERGLYDVAWTAARRRTAHPHRAVVLAGTAEEGARLLEALSTHEGAPPAGTATGQALNDGRVVFAFAGNGSQWAGMGADLLREEPVFRGAVARVDEALEPYLGWSVQQEMETADAGRMQATEVAQPVLFAFQVALAELLGSRGIRPAAVLGHSVGEIAAAYVAGALDLPAAALVVAERSRAQAATRGTGRMAAVSSSREQTVKEIAPYGGVLEIAAVNGADDVTICGPGRRLAQLGQELEARGVFFRLLDLDYAFHSRAMDPVRQGLTSALASLHAGATRVPLVSTVTGLPATGRELTADYWWRNVREPVAFGPALEHLLTEGYDTFVEIGPHPVLRPYLRKAMRAAERPSLILAPCARAVDAPTAVATAVAQLLAVGARPDWETIFRVPGRLVALPSYRWQRERQFHGDPQWWLRSLGETGPVQHPLLGVGVPVKQPTWSTLIEPDRLPWLADHQVTGSVVMPATGYLEMALAAGRLVHDAPVEVDNLLILRALDVPWNDDTADVHVQVSLSEQDQALEIAARPSPSTAWQLHARARVRRLLADRPEPMDIDAIRARLRSSMAGSEHYARAQRAGLSYGPAFQVLTHLDFGQDEAVATYTQTAPADGYHAHPALLDGALQAGAVFTAVDGFYQPFLPVGVDALQIWQELPNTGLIHVRARERGTGEQCWDITITDPDGQVCAVMAGARLRRLADAVTDPVQHLVSTLRSAPTTADRNRSAPLPSPHILAEAVQPHQQVLEEAWRRDGHDAALNSLHQTCAHLIADALAHLLPPGVQEFSVGDLVDAGMLRQHARLAELLARVTACGVIEPVPAEPAEPQRWRLPAQRRSLEHFRQTMSAFPQHVVEAILFGRCSLHLAEVLRGERDPLQLLFDEPDRHLIEYFYSDAAQPRFHNQLLRGLLREIVAAWPADRPLRILEVGAGTGGSTAVLLDELPPERTTYTFTDRSASFFLHAQSRFADADFLTYQCLDLEEDPAEQGFTEASFDLVIATNVLHATTDLRQTLAKVSWLLVDDGQLLAFETHNPGLLAPVFGPLEGFWNFTDTSLRKYSPLLAADAWGPLLQSCGFGEVAQLGHDHPADQLDYSVICAQRAARTAPLALPGLPAVDTTRWIVAAESTDSPLARHLAATLARAGAEVRTTVCAKAAEQAARWTEDQISVHVALIFDSDPTGDQATAVTDQATARLGALRALATACSDTSRAAPAQLWVVTRPSGLHPAPEVPAHPEDAALWGATRTLANEHSQLAVRRISLEQGPRPADDAERLAAELLHPSDEDEVVLTRNGRFVPRVRPQAPAVARPADTASTAYTLRLDQAGLKPRLAWTATDPAAPADNEVVIAVEAAALNYRDVMLAIGLLPPGAETPLPGGPALGLECSGTITAVGRGVTAFRPGDRVYALAPSSLSSHVTVDARLVGPVPDGMSCTEAATLPVVFFTAHHALERLARLQRDETVLIHGAAGGVGLAALQLAQSRGARVIATAGTPAKRDLLRMLGVSHVLNSRTLGFGQRVSQLTGGQGVDVVLNSLAGEAITRSLECLRPGGRFLELGKRDIYASTPLGLRPFKNNIAFYGIDAHQMISECLPQAEACFEEVVNRVSTGTYRPLPHLTYPAARVDEALRVLQRSRHIGKIIITFDEPPSVVQAAEPLRLSTDGSYLVTGGLGGLGAVAARRLADHGARHLTLVSRRGAGAPEAADLADSLGRRGVQVTVVAADVTQETDLRRVLQTIDTSGHPLSGVVHAAMGMDDASLVELTDERLRTVLEPKMLGGALLHRLTHDRDLRLFAMCSSVTAWVGNAYQAHYTAANSYLEALARHRQATGQAGTTVAWGAVDEAGYAARHGITDLLNRLGLSTISPDEACAALEHAAARGTAVTAVGRIDWRRMRSMLPAVQHPRLAGLIPAHTSAEDLSDQLRHQLATATPEEALTLAADAVTEVLAGILQIDPSRLNRDQRLDQLGLDSLMAVEAVIAARDRLGCELPTLEFLNAHGITDLARRALIRLGHQPPKRTHGPALSN